MNILFLTDSLGYPRVEPAGTDASETWTYKIRDNFKNMSHLSFFFDMKTGRHTESLVFDIKNHIVSYSPNIIILQVGIVDCYPRALSMQEMQILSRIPMINSISKYLVKKFYKTIVRRRNLAYVNIKEFEKNLEEIKFSFPDAQWIVVPIGPPNIAYQEKNPLIKERIESYNRILERVFTNSFLSSLFCKTDFETLYLDDHHHLSRFGHCHLAERISRELSKLLIN